jgi:hypothetical protein
MDAAAADAFWTELEERDAERRAAKWRLELQDLVSRSEDMSALWDLGSLELGSRGREGLGPEHNGHRA